VITPTTGKCFVNKTTKLNQNMTNRFFYFKVTFLSLAAGIFAGMVVYGIFDIDFSNSEELSKLLWKSFVTAIGTGLIMGILNMFFKIGNFPKKENS
jgi:hypothetical protein